MNLKICSVTNRHVSATEEEHIQARFCQGVQRDQKRKGRLPRVLHSMPTRDQPRVDGQNSDQAASGLAEAQAELQWTDAKNSLKVDTVKALLQVRVNFDENCAGFHKLLMTNGELRKKIQGSEKWE